jgi:hypothetical protein
LQATLLEGNAGVKDAFDEVNRNPARLARGLQPHLSSRQRDWYGKRT